MRSRIPAALGLSVLLLLCGCDKNEESSAQTGAVTSTTTTAQQASPVEVRDYEFPEFLELDSTGDMLANVVQAGFDPETASVSVEESPSDKYDCKKCLLGGYYSFAQDGCVGLINSEGTLILKPDKYISATPVSNELIELVYRDDEGEHRDLFLVRSGFGRFIKQGYDPAEIAITEIAPENEQGTAQYCLNVRGIGATQAYDTIEPLTQGALKTSTVYRSAYKASVGGRYYYLILDDYSSVTVCEAAYAQIRMKIAGTYGECYILNGDHYSELNKMIKSFGREQQAVKPSKDEALDYIQIVFGICTGEQLTVTVSADGLCLTDGLTVKGQPVNKFFTAYPKEVFADLVGWVSEVAASEYTAAEFAEAPGEEQ